MRVWHGKRAAASTRASAPALGAAGRRERPSGANLSQSLSAFLINFKKHQAGVAAFLPRSHFRHDLNFSTLNFDLQRALVADVRRILAGNQGALETQNKDGDIFRIARGAGQLSR